MSNYATKKELEHATGIDTSDLVAKKDFDALKSGVDNLKKVDDLHVGKLKTVPVDLKKLSNVAGSR